MEVLGPARGRAASPRETTFSAKYLTLVPIFLFLYFTGGGGDSEARAGHRSEAEVAGRTVLERGSAETERGPETGGRTGARGNRELWEQEGGQQEERDRRV